jgi:hypothetical protein
MFCMTTNNRLEVNLEEQVISKVILYKYAKFGPSSYR